MNTSIGSTGPGIKSDLIAMAPIDVLERWSLAVLLMTSALAWISLGSLPDYSQEHYSSELSNGSLSPVFLRGLRYDNEDKPRQCRIDLCPAEVTSDQRKGTFRWPDAQLETRVYLRCPYSILEPVYVYRDCVFRPEDYNDTYRPGLNNSFSDWDLPEIDVCPDPPLAELLKTLEANEEPYPPDWNTFAIDQLYETLTKYADAPVFNDDIPGLADSITRAILVTLSVNTSLSRDRTQRAFTVIDRLFVLDASRVLLGYRRQQENEKLVEALVVLAEMWTPGEGQYSSVLEGNYISLVAAKLERTPVLHYNFSVTDPIVDPSNRLVTSVTTLVRPGQEETDTDILHVLYIGYMLPFGRSLVLDIQSPDSMKNMSSSKELIGAQALVSAALYVSTSRHRHHDNGGLVLWSRDTLAVITEITFAYDTALELDSPATCGGIGLYADLGGTISKFSTSRWYARDNTRNVLYTAGVCVYTTRGLHGILARVLMGDSSGTPGVFPLPGTRLPTTKISTSFSEFLGFPYKSELFIAGEVLRAISLVCLVITVLAYAIFKKARHGITTQILLNLCVALILFNMVLYIAESIGHSRWGCRMSNILRYYLVLVSLAWNVTEAVNLYLMLVKVFKSYISHFVLKAACMAWGFPLIPIIIVLIVDHRGYDGVYSENCNFRCVLRDSVFYFAYLIPVLFMVSINIVIFSLVVDKLRRRAPIRPGETSLSLRTQVCGAVSMMFLLGIPWVFSAFGAINISNDSLSLLSGIFQVITIVFLNLQGAFIFLFHCVRNSDMRKQWRDVAHKKGQSLSFSLGSPRSGLGSSAAATSRRTQESILSNSSSRTSLHQVNPLPPKI